MGSYRLVHWPKNAGHGPDVVRSATKTTKKEQKMCLKWDALDLLLAPDTKIHVDASQIPGFRREYYVNASIKILAPALKHRHKLVIIPGMQNAHHVSTFQFQTFSSSLQDYE